MTRLTFTLTVRTAVLNSLYELVSGLLSWSVHTNAENKENSDLFYIVDRFTGPLPHIDVVWETVNVCEAFFFYYSLSDNTTDIILVQW